MVYLYIFLYAHQLLRTPRVYYICLTFRFHLVRTVSHPPMTQIHSEGDSSASMVVFPAPCALEGPVDSARKAAEAQATEGLFFARPARKTASHVGVAQESFEEENEELYDCHDMSEGARLARSLFDADVVSGKVFADTVSFFRPGNLWKPHGVGGRRRRDKVQFFLCIFNLVLSLPGAVD